MIRKKWDERQKTDMLRAEHYAFRTMWWILAAGLTYQGYILAAPFSEMKWELAAFAAGSVVALTLSMRKGMWDSRIKFTVPNCLRLSAVFTAAFGALYAIGKYRQYEACREDVAGVLLPITLVFCVAVFVLCFLTLYLTGSYTRRREKKIEKELGMEEEE